MTWIGDFCFALFFVLFVCMYKEMQVSYVCEEKEVF